jgi:hypothetical protein
MHEAYTAGSKALNQKAAFFYKSALLLLCIDSIYSSSLISEERSLNGREKLNFTQKNYGN